MHIMSQTRIYKIIIGILFLLNIFMGYQLILSYPIRNEKNIKLEEKIITYSIINKQLKEFIKIQYQFEEKLAEKFFQEKYDHWKNKSHVIVFFNESHCKSCIKEIILDFSLIKQKTGFDKFVLMGSFNEEKDFYSYANQIDYEFMHEHISSDYNMFEKIEHPIVFVVDKSFDIKLLYAPDLLPEWRGQYFYKILMPYLKAY